MNIFHLNNSIFSFEFDYQNCISLEGKLLMRIKLNKNFKIVMSAFLGSTISFVAFCTNISLDVWFVSIRPIHFLIWFLWLKAIKTIVNPNLLKNTMSIPIFVGAAVGTVIGYMVNGGFFYGSVFTSYYILFGGFVGLFLIIKRKDEYFIHESQRITIKNIWRFIWSVIVLLSIASFRIYNVLYRDVPNEERSFMIGETEVHHFVTGLLIIGLMQILIYKLRLSKVILMIFITILIIGQSFVADQLTYIIMFPLNDEMYFTWFSLLGAVLGLGYFVFKLYSTKGVDDDNERKLRR
jgi:hypothetical protein